jgi:hypothetical protein
MKSRIREILENASRNKCNILLKFKDGHEVAVSLVVPVDESIYNEPDRWTGFVENVVAGDDSYKKLFRPGGGIDFHEPDLADVKEIECKS